MLIARLSNALVPLERLAAMALLIAAILIGPYYWIEWPGSGRMGSLALLGAGLLLALLCLGPLGTRIQALLARLGDRLSFKGILIAGIVLQIAAALLTQPVATSDGRTYLLLAEQLAQGGAYRDPAGMVAFWPPGLPLLLTPFVAMFGVGLAAIASANLVLYVIGVASARALGAAIWSERAGLYAALLLTVWPSRLLCSGVASKEGLTIAMMLLSAAMCVRAFDARGGTAFKFAIAGGVAAGVAALAQPGLLLFVLIVPLCYRYALARHSLGMFALLSAVVVASAALTMAPWHVRNCMVFDGQFCGIATNGGSVFYRANNPLATGEWTAEGEVPITHLPELVQNKLGFELGKKWISEHPKAFALLAARKLGLLLRDDRYGAYWSILRGEGERHEQSWASASPRRVLAYQVTNIISGAFWILIVSMAARWLWQSRRLDAAEGALARLLPLVYPLLYCAAVFAVFESDRRQHMIALALLLVLCGAALAGPRQRVATSGPA